MLRGSSVVLGIGLVILWIAGLNTVDTPAWLPWLDLLAAVGAFIVAGTTIQPKGMAAQNTATRYAGPVLMAVCLFLFWVIGLSSGHNPAVPWWNFAFGCAFLIAALLPPQEKRHLSPVESQFRRSA